MKKSFVLVHLGDEFFEYINDCIEQITKFNDDIIYLIIFEKHKDMVKNKNVKLLFTNQIEKTKNHILFDETNKLDKNFRNGFWRHSTERFLYLENAISKYNLENVIHLENDTLLYFNYNDYIKIFQENYDIATVFDNDNRAIPCIVYIKNLESISNFNSFILKFSDKNDMVLFSDYREINKNINLPILPTDYNLNLKTKTGHTTKDKNQYFKNFNKFNSIFDGAAIGQYIGGIDPRNQNGNTIGFENESCLFNPKNMTFLFIKDELNRNIPYVIWNEKQYKINNLHIHSKNLKKYLS